MDANVINGNFLIGGIVFFCLIIMVIDNMDYLRQRKNRKKDLAELCFRANAQLVLSKTNATTKK